MKRIISMPLDTGGIVQLEVEDSANAPVMRGGSVQPVLERTATSFEAAVAKVKPMAVALVEQFAGAIKGTTEVKVKFGLKFNAEVGAIISSVGSEANFEIEVRWVHNNTS